MSIHTRSILGLIRQRMTRTEAATGEEFESRWVVTASPSGNGYTATFRESPCDRAARLEARSSEQEAALARYRKVRATRR